MSASEDHTLRVWRLTDGACLRTLTGHTDAVTAVVDVGSGRVASGGDDGVLRVWDVLSGKQLQQIPTGASLIFCIAALWRNRVATGHNYTGEIRLWSLQAGEPDAAGVLRGHDRTVVSLAVVGGGGCTGAQRQQLASGSSDLSLRVWDVDAGTCTAVLRGHTQSVWCLADLGGGRLLSGSLDKSLRVWNPATGACVAMVPNAHGESSILSACALLDGPATGSGSGSVQRWKWDEGTNTLTADGEALLSDGNGWVYSLATAQKLRPDRELQLLAGCEYGTLRVLGSGPEGRGLLQHSVLAGHDGRVRAVTFTA